MWSAADSETASHDDGPLAVALATAKEELRAERAKNEALAAQVEALRKRAVEIAIQSETEEEAISLRLLKRAEELAREKARILCEVEREEEYLTNTLQRKMTQLQVGRPCCGALAGLGWDTHPRRSVPQREKVELQNQLEEEQEFVLNRIQREKAALEARVASERAEMAARLSAAGQERERLLARLAQEEAHNTDVLKVRPRDVLSV